MEATIDRDKKAVATLMEEHIRDTAEACYRGDVRS